MDRPFRVGCIALCARPRGNLCKGEYDCNRFLFLYTETPFFLQNDVFLAMRFHIATPDDLDSIIRILPQLATYHIDVLPLSSGRNGAVSGEVSRLGVSPARFGSLFHHFAPLDCATSRHVAPWHSATCGTTRPCATVSPRGVSRCLF